MLPDKTVNNQPTLRPIARSTDRSMANNNQPRDSHDGLEISGGCDPKQSHVADHVYRGKANRDLTMCSETRSIDICSCDPQLGPQVTDHVTHSMADRYLFM